MTTGELGLTDTEENQIVVFLMTLTDGYRRIEIASAGDRPVCFDLIDFYHNESGLLGADTRLPPS